MILLACFKYFSITFIVLVLTLRSYLVFLNCVYLTLIVYILLYISSVFWLFVVSFNGYYVYFVIIC